ncbi:MAG: GDSL-type esterase/lipase family protein [Treponema sp.]|jgi:lysophospholipase L1-like esterase|nr:GDSL-type esterase/lipase family protein [Treponema sp.]
MKKKPWLVFLVAACVLLMYSCDDTPRGPLNPVVGDFDIGELTYNYDGSKKTVNITPKNDKSGGAITVYYEGTEGTTYTKSQTAPSAVGKYTITFDVAEATGWNAVTGLRAGTLVIIAPVPKNPAVGDFDIGELTDIHDGNQKAVNITPKNGKSGGAITVYYEGTEGTTYTKSQTAPSAVGKYAVTFDVAEVTGWNAITGLSAGTLVILDLSSFTSKDYRTINALLKLKNGGNITFAAIGGSITQGGCVTGVYNWLNAKAPGKVKYVNAGIGASDSSLGALRFQDHVLRHNPDIVVIEYSVNDGYYYSTKSALYNRTYEGMVRQALENSGRAVYLLQLHTGAQGNSKSNPTHTSQTAIGNKYNLPVFKWMDYAGVTGNWKDTGFYNNYAADDTHPNANGNASVAKGITDYLDGIWSKLPNNNINVSTTLPTAQYFDDYQKLSIIKWGDSAVTSGSWTQYNGQSGNWGSLSSSALTTLNGFQTNGLNELTIRFKGKSVYVIGVYKSGGAGMPWENSGAGTTWVTKSGGGDTPARYVGSGSSWGGPEWFGTLAGDGLEADKEHILHIKGAASGGIYIFAVVASDK